MKNFHCRFLILLTLICSCKKNPKEEPSPNITLNIIQQTQSALFSGRIDNLLLSNVKETGFIWSAKPDPAAGLASVFLYKNDSPALQFEYNVLSGLTKDSTYYVKAFYVDNANTYHYSQQTPFKSNGTKQPGLTYLTKTYTWGDEVELTMDALNNSDLNSINIIINKTTIIHPTRISNTKIYFNVTNDITNGFNLLSVAVLGQESNMIGLSLTPPVITPTDDVNLIVGKTLTINGQFFNPVLSKNMVSIGASKLNVVSATANKLVVEYNSATISQSGTLSVQTGVNLAAYSTADYFIYKYLRPKKSFPGEARENSVAVTLNGNIYTGLGKSRATNQSLKDWWKYDPAADVWTRVADCPQRALAVRVFSIKNKAYIGLGLFDDYPSNAFYAYNPASDTWTMINSFPGTQTLYGAYFNSAQYGYIVGGEQRTPSAFIQVNDVWRFDPANNSWKKLSPFPGQAREMASGFTINNKAYIVGGVVQAPFATSKEAWSFDMTTETWKQIASIPYEAGSNGQFLFGLNNKGYVGGGNTNDTDGVSSFVYEYDPATDTWTKKEQILNAIRYGTAYTTIANTGYVICGWSNTYPYSEGSQSFFEFIP
ncbi:Kelch repeat-containing protein [Mucilaginibacter angelicae]|uniref:Kelch repeat-containing protein n=1 Tax=Mucilaginibacter angelicae TaxID=869718 RepID=A0ABV6L445_9SPHI